MAIWADRQVVGSHDNEQDRWVIKKTDRQAERQTGRQAGRQTEKQADD